MSALAEGLLRVHKPAGPTSHDVVAWVRRASGQRRAGHSGTLDPPAEGLLLVALGRATRLIRFLPAAPKRYRGTFLLGWTSSTDDATGERLTAHDGPLPPTEAVVAAACRLEGRGQQVPPSVSARRVGGERLYRLARRGLRPVAPARPIEVERFRVRPAGEPGRYTFEAAVSPGTYVRGLVRDLGAALSCGGVLESLARTAIGELTLDGALSAGPGGAGLTAESIQRSLVPLEAMPLDLPDRRLADGEQARRFAAGLALDDPETDPRPQPWRRVVDPAGRLLGVGRIEDGRLRPRVVLAGGAPATVDE